jgi:putative oxidoreductase
MVDALGLLATRLTVGLSFASHGTQKAFGWFEGPGPEKAAGFLETLGFKPGTQFATAASYSEIAAGTLIALGFGGPVGPALLISTMIVAQTSAHMKNGFFAQKGGIELGLVYASAALGLAASGYGPLSLDHALGLQKPLRHPVITALALAGAAAGAYYILEQRDFTPPDGTLATPTFSAEQRNGEVTGASAAPAPS